MRFSSLNFHHLEVRLQNMFFFMMRITSSQNNPPHLSEVFISSFGAFCFLKWGNHRHHTILQYWLRWIPSLSPANYPNSPSHQERTYQEQFWTPKIGIVSFQLGNYLIFSNQKPRHIVKACYLISSTVDGGESGTLKGTLNPRLQMEGMTPWSMNSFPCL